MSVSQSHNTPKPHLAGQLDGDGNADTDANVAGKTPGPLRQRVLSLRLPESPAQRGSAGRLLPWGICLLLAAGLAVASYFAIARPKDKDTDAAHGPATAPSSSPFSPASPSAAQAPAAETASSGAIVLEAKGYIVPVHQILVSPKVSGMIVRLPIQEGMRVKKGDVVAELEDTDYRADYERAEASLEATKQHLLELEHGNRPEEISEATAELAESQAQLVELKAEWERTKRLLPKNAVSQQDYEVTESKYWAMYRRVQRLQMALKLMQEGPRVERIDNARAEVLQMKADVAKTRWRLDNCTIRAPVSGTILKKNAEEGNVVNPIAMNGSFSLCEMADLSDLEVDLPIQERDVARVFKGQKCKVCAEAYLDRTYDGYVSRLMPIADRAKGAVPVRVKVSVPAAEEGVYLKPEMGVNVSFLGATPTARKEK